MPAYLHFGFGKEPRLTIEVPHRETEVPRHGHTRTGYGPHIPSCHMVKWEGRWRRVYFACYGNAASAYIGPRDAWIATFDLV